MNYQWYPGHMTKAVRQMQEDVKLVDLIIELLDARIPISSRNPDIDKIGQNKSRIVLLNKSDLSDGRRNNEWVDYFKDKDIHCLLVNSKNKATLKALDALVLEACKEKIERDRRRGIKNRPVRAMVVGIPNVGKSTFINSFAGRACAKTGNKPGVTKGKQWIRLSKTLELLDTPGILWPKFESQIVGEHLALIGSINDDIIDTVELSCALLDFLVESYPNLLKERFEIELEDAKNYEILEKIAIKRNYLLKGSTPDIEKMAMVLLDEFRSGKLGRISVEVPNQVMV